MRMCSERCHPEGGAASNLPIRLTLAPTEGSCLHSRGKGFTAHESAPSTADEILRSRASDCVSYGSARRSLRMTCFLARFGNTRRGSTRPPRHGSGGEKRSSRELRPLHSGSGRVAWLGPLVVQAGRVHGLARRRPRPPKTSHRGGLRRATGSINPRTLNAIMPQGPFPAPSPSAGVGRPWIAHRTRWHPRPSVGWPALSRSQESTRTEEHRWPRPMSGIHTVVVGGVANAHASPGGAGFVVRPAECLQHFV
jgi:hypothetical protein